jgi:AcrR family transcriptional regulator
MPKVTMQYEEARKKQIIEGALGVFAVNGYRQTTMEQIVSALQMSKGALYLYFKSKEELYVTVLQAYNEQRFAALSTAYEAGDSLPVKFEKLISHYCNFFGTNEMSIIRLWLEGYLESDHIPVLDEIKEQSYQRFKTLLVGLLEQGQRNGELRRDIVIEDLAVLVMAMTDGLMLHSLVKGRRIDAERVHALVRSIENGVVSGGNLSRGKMA